MSKKDPVRKNIREAILTELLDSGLTMEEGVSEMMSAVCNVLAATAEACGAEKKEFIKETFRQCLEQIQ